MPPVSYPAPTSSEGTSAPHAGRALHVQRGKYAAEIITSQTRLTGDVPLQAGFCRHHNELPFRPRIKKNSSLHPVRYDLRTTNRPGVSHRAYTLTVQGFSTTSADLYCCTVTLPAPAR